MKGKIGFISTEAEFTPKTVETRELRTALVYRLRIVVDDRTTSCARACRSPSTSSAPKRRTPAK